MAKKNIGITVFGVVVAIAAFITTNIWAQKLHEDVDSGRRAGNEWSETQKEVDKDLEQIGASIPTDIASTQHQLDQKMRLIKETDNAITPLMQVKGVHSSNTINAAVQMTEQYISLDKRFHKADSSENVASMYKEASGLLPRMTGLGVLFDQDVRNHVERMETRESHVKYAGYGLSILSIIVAGIAQLRKSD